MFCYCSGSYLRTEMNVFFPNLGQTENETSLGMNAWGKIMIFSTVMKNIMYLNIPIIYVWHCALWQTVLKRYIKSKQRAQMGKNSSTSIHDSSVLNGKHLWPRSNLWFQSRFPSLLRLLSVTNWNVLSHSALPCGFTIICPRYKLKQITKTFWPRFFTDAVFFITLISVYVQRLRKEHSQKHSSIFNIPLTVQVSHDLPCYLKKRSAKTPDWVPPALMGFIHTWVQFLRPHQRFLPLEGGQWLVTLKQRCQSQTKVFSRSSEHRVHEVV